MPKRTKAPAEHRKVVPIAEAAKRRRDKSLRDLTDAVEGADEETFSGEFTMVGNMNLLEGSFDDAITAFSRALSAAPEDVSALAGRGRAYRAIGEHALALADFDRVIALVPDKAQYHLDRSNALAPLGRLKEAVAACTRAIELEPGKAGAYYTRAVYRSHVEDDDAGVRADFDRMVELAPTEVAYLRQRAEYLMGSWDLEAALADIDRLLALTPDDAKLHYQRGHCLSQRSQGRFQRGLDGSESEEEARVRCEAALASLERAIELDPHHDDAYFELVCVREQMNDEEAHRAALDRAIAVMPEETTLLLVRLGRRHRRGDLEGAAADGRRLRELGFKGELQGGA
jgi:tetratricopeptide (TPR) repeat protein